MIIRQGDSDEMRTAGNMPVTIVLDRLRSAHNAGNVFRIADAVRAERIITCGYTPAPGHQKLTKTAMGAEEIVPCQTMETSVEAVRALKAQGYRVYGVETVEGASLYCETQFQFPAAILLGNEALGVDPAALELCDDFVCLPADGIKNSINVGNCAAVVLFEIRRQFRK